MVKYVRGQETQSHHRKWQWPCYWYGRLKLLFGVYSSYFLPLYQLCSWSTHECRRLAEELYHPRWKTYQTRRPWLTRTKDTERTSVRWPSVRASSST